MQVRRAAARWQGGWWSAAQRAESPNRGQRPSGERPSLVVLHSISLPAGRYGGRAVERLFLNTLPIDRHRSFEALRGLRVSAHFFVRRDGAVVQFVDCDQRAWHAGVSSWRGRDNCNDWSVGIEIEGLEGLPFTATQYRTLGRLLRALQQRYPIRDVLGHEHVAPGRKRDPGAAFDWARLRRRICGHDARVWPIADVDT